jgi:hypothetical protein
VAVLLAFGPVLSGCSDVRSALGYEKQAPDEFAVVARAPLSVPPNFSLRPPRPGAERPQEPSTRQGARALILKNSGAADTAGTANTAGDGAIRRLLGTADADPNIRQVINKETAAFVFEEEYFIDKLLFWKDKPAPGVLVDAEKEKQRLQENAALGKPVSDGETPTIKRKRGGIIEGLF